MMVLWLGLQIKFCFCWQNDKKSRIHLHTGEERQQCPMFQRSPGTTGMQSASALRATCSLTRFFFFSPGRRKWAVPAEVIGWQQSIYHFLPLARWGAGERTAVLHNSDTGNWKLMVPVVRAPWVRDRRFLSKNYVCMCICVYVYIY